MATKKPRKFDAVLAGLEKSEPDMDDYQQKVIAEKDRLRSGEAASESERNNTKALFVSLDAWLESWSVDGAPSSHTPESLARLYIKLTEELEELEAVRYDRQVRLTAIEQMLVNSNEANQPGWGLYGADPDTVKLASGACVDVRPKPDAKVIDKEAFRRWCATPTDRCLDCGMTHDTDDHHNLVHAFRPGAGLADKLQLWPSTMAAIAAERLLDGLPPPDGVTVKTWMAVKYRRA